LNKNINNNAFLYIGNIPHIIPLKKDISFFFLPLIIPHLLFLFSQIPISPEGSGRRINKVPKIELTKTSENLPPAFAEAASRRQVAPLYQRGVIPPLGKGRVGGIL